MSLRGGDANAMRAHGRLGGETAGSPALADADSVTGGCTTDRDSDENQMLKLEIELSLANRRIDKLTNENDDLARQNKRLTASENGLGDRVVDLKKELIEQYNRASKAEKRADEAEMADSVTNSQELRAMQEKMADAEKEKDTALKARDDALKKADQAKLDAQLQSGRLQSAQADNQRLASDLSAARSANANIHRTETASLGARSVEREVKIRQLESDVATYETKIDQLADKCDLLKLRNAQFVDASEKTKKDLKTSQNTVVFLEGRNENLEADNGELREKLARSAIDLQRLQVVHANMVDQHNRAPSAQFNGAIQDTRLAAENARLKDKIQARESEVNTLRLNMAHNITQFDLAWDGWRLFNCEHATLRDIPDANHSTCERPWDPDIIMSLLEHWMEDDQFIKEYNNERRYVLQHHRAHERVPQGKGVASFRIKNEFVKADQKRGIPIKY